MKDARFDCEWTDAQDASLLRGIHKYGTGSWDSIHMDSELNLSQACCLMFIHEQLINCIFHHSG